MVDFTNISSIPWYASTALSSGKANAVNPNQIFSLEPLSQPVDKLELKIKTALILGGALSSHIELGVKDVSSSPMDVFTSIEDFRPHVSIGFYEGLYSRHKADLNVSILSALKIADFRVSHYTEDAPRKAYLGALLYSRNREMFIHDFLTAKRKSRGLDPEMDSVYAFCA